MIPTSTAWFYQNILKPALFRFPADDVHETFLQLGEILGNSQLARSSTALLWKGPDLKPLKVDGMNFPSPVGLAAGFDYGACLIGIAPSLGFGFQTIGTITAQSYPGNSPPMLGRAPLSQSLWVNKGFKNAGMSILGPKIKKAVKRIPLGISIGASNRLYSSVEDQIKEYAKAFHYFEEHPAGHDYYELNISCPNLQSAFDFSEPEHFRKLLQEFNSWHVSRPTWLKMPIDTTNSQFIELIKLADRSALRGLIIGNLTKDRSNPNLWQSEVAKFSKGGFSGKPCQARSLEKIRIARHVTTDRFTIIGCGGIFSGEDVEYALEAGANLVQIVSALVYQGPQIVGQMKNWLKKNSAYIE